jgi:hypothetical protein
LPEGRCPVASGTTTSFHGTRQTGAEGMEEEAAPVDTSLAAGRRGCPRGSRALLAGCRMVWVPSTRLLSFSHGVTIDVGHVCNVPSFVAWGTFVTCLHSWRGARL